MMSEQKNTGFLSHLIELRDRALKIVLSVGIVFLCLIPFAQGLFTWLAAPLLSAMPEGQNMIATSVITPFLTPYKLALLAAFLIALPNVFYQMWSFFAPGLYKHEKKLVSPLLISSVLLFYTGIAFAYFMLLPMMFEVLQTFTPEGVDSTPDIAEYLDFVMMIFIAFGFGFEMPIATILLISSGMTTAKKLGQNRPYVIVGAFVVGMFLTPPDVISQIMLAIPMWLLFEIGLIASKLFDKRKNASKEKKETPDKTDKDTTNSHHTHAAATAAASTAVLETIPMAETEASDNKPVFEDEHYTYEEDDDVNLDDDDEYRPLTDDEMEAEIKRIEKEFEDLESEEVDQHKSDASDKKKPT